MAGAFFAAPLTMAVACTPTYANEEAKSYDMMLSKSIPVICLKLVELNILSSEHAQKISDFREQREPGLGEPKVSYQDGKIVFSYSPEYAESLHKLYGKDKNAGNMMFFKEFAKMVSDADLLLYHEGNIEHLNPQLIELLREGMTVSFLNCFFKKEESIETYCKSEALLDYMKGEGKGVLLRNNFNVYERNFANIPPAPQAKPAAVAETATDTTPACTSSTHDQKVATTYTKTEEDKKKASEDPIGNFFAAILLCLVVSLVAIYPFMLRIRFREKKRRWVQLPMPERVEPGQTVCPENLRSEFSETMEFIAGLRQLDCDGVKIPCFTEKREIDAAFEIIHRLKNLPNLNADELLHLNMLGEQANEAQSRHICCDKKLYRIASFFGFICRDAYLMPLYKFNNPNPLYIRIAQAFTMAFGIGGFVEAYKHVKGEYEPVYIDRKGNLWKRAGLEPLFDGCLSGLFISAIVIIMSPFFVIPCSLAHIYRNYFANR